MLSSRLSPKNFFVLNFLTIFLVPCPVSGKMERFLNSSMLNFLATDGL